MKRIKNSKEKRLPYAILLAVVFVAGVIGLFGDSTMAADTAPSLIILDQYDRQLSASTTVDMRTDNLLLRLNYADGSDWIADTSKYTILWELAFPDTQKDRVKLTPNGTTCQVLAQSPGDVTIHVTVTDNTIADGGGVILDTTCNITVMFAIDDYGAGNGSSYDYAKKTDTVRSLIMDMGETSSVQLGLSFGDASKATWQTDNPRVAEVGENTGVIVPKGAGKTIVRVTYRPEGDNTAIYTASMEVYVLPRICVSKDDAVVNNYSDPNIYKNYLTAALDIDNDECLYTNVNYNGDSVTSGSKIEWIIKQEDSSGKLVKIADSKNMTSDLIKITGENYGNKLEVTGVAGRYYVYFYTSGTYDETLDDGTNEGTNFAYPTNPTVVALTIKSPIKDNETKLNIGDSYNLAEAYNMTVEDFNRCFDVTLKMENGNSASEYAAFNKTTGAVTAVREGNVVATIQVKNDSEIQSYIKDLVGYQDGGTSSDPDATAVPWTGVFKTTIRMLDKIELDRSSITISKGQSYQLSIITNRTYNSVVWSSSDAQTVSVDDTGLITGLKVTSASSVVTITATLDLGSGLYRVATCDVKVEEAIDSFTLSPSDDQNMLKGDHLLVKAVLKQTVSVAPLEWMSTDESVFTVEQSADGKTATITAAGGGKADLMVYNTINKQYKVLHITVRVPIESIKFANDSLSLAQYTKGYNIHDEVSYTPTNATDNTLTWSSSDTSVITVNKDGYLSFVAPGTALISVYPSYNPYNVMASCRVTVLGTPTSMTLSKSDITMNVKESVMVDVNFLPINTTSELTWKPNDKTIVSISYDSTKQIATLTGLAPGSTDINVVTTEGIISNIKVTVRQPATSISIQEKDVILLSGQSTNLTAVMTPSNSTDTLLWESDDTTVATVDSTGKVTGIKPGTTYVFVTAYNGGTQSCFARVAITVRDAITGISLPQTEYAMDEGDSIVITPTITPETAYNKNITWSLSNTEVATLSSVKGSETEIEVTAIAGGSAMLTAVTEDGGYTVSCLIIVTPTPTEEPTPTAEPTVEPTPTPEVIPTKVKVTPKTKVLKVGKTFYVKAKVTGSTQNKKVKWTSSKKKVCTVTQSGKVKGKKVGTAYIKATARDGSGASARCKVRVIRPVTKISLKPSSAKMLVGEILKVKATVKPKNATIKKIKWSTKDASIATVDITGRVVGVAPGMVEIKAKAKDGFGKSARCYVTVKEAVEATGVTVENSTITLAKGKAVQSGIVAAPANTTTSIRYYSDNKKVASVDSHGKITSHKVGQATIYGETANGKIGYCDVLVVDLNRKGIEMRQYDTEQLHVNEISDGVTWYSKDINIASVDSSGLVTGRKKGTTIVYAVVNGVKLGCRVKVKKIK